MEIAESRCIGLEMFSPTRMTSGLSVARSSSVGFSKKEMSPIPLFGVNPSALHTAQLAIVPVLLTNGIEFFAVDQCVASCVGRVVRHRLRNELPIYARPIRGKTPNIILLDV